MGCQAVVIHRDMPLVLLKEGVMCRYKRPGKGASERTRRASPLFSFTVLLRPHRRAHLLTIVHNVFQIAYFVITVPCIYLSSPLSPLCCSLAFRKPPPFRNAAMGIYESIITLASQFPPLSKIPVVAVMSIYLNDSQRVGPGE